MSFIGEKRNQVGSSLTVLLVKDLEKSKKWYSDVFGCKVTSGGRSVTG